MIETEMLPRLESLYGNGAPGHDALAATILTLEHAAAAAADAFIGAAPRDEVRRHLDAFRAAGRDALVSALGLTEASVESLGRAARKQVDGNGDGLAIHPERDPPDILLEDLCTETEVLRTIWIRPDAPARTCFLTIAALHGVAGAIAARLDAQAA